MISLFPRLPVSPADPAVFLPIIVGIVIQRADIFYVLLAPQLFRLLIWFFLSNISFLHIINQNWLVLIDIHFCWLYMFIYSIYYLYLYKFVN
jgi:hypothetical protein